MSLRSEPTTYNRLLASKAAEQRITYLTQATLIRVNPVTSLIEPRLATAWTASPDGLTWTFTLRPAQFSDGAPFTAADVVFTLQALYDKKVASPMTGAFLVNGQPLTARALSDHEVQVTFPSAYAPGVRMFDGLPILPAHKLSAALAAGTFNEAWRPSGNPADVVGLGPFALAAITPGQSIRFVRNPHYWATDDKGHALPYLDEVDVNILPAQDAEMLRLESGDLDLVNDFIRPEDVAKLKSMADQHTAALIDAGISVDTSALWIDLAPESKAAKTKPWLQREEFRLGLSAAIDRQAIVDAVYLGAGVPIGGPVTPGFGPWFRKDLPVPVHDVARAKALFAKAGLTDKTGDGVLRDASGKPARFTIMTQSGKTDRERTSALIADQLKAVGLTVDVVGLDPNALFARVSADDYDAMYYGTDTGGTDPVDSIELWLSSGGFHLWNMHEKTPATPWEAEIDNLMRQIVASANTDERQKLFGHVQQIFADHQPALYFAAPRVWTAASSRLQGVSASAIKPPVLWNVERLSMAASK
jgi:peptide/nickel transport system substrate-binding protein